MNFLVNRKRIAFIFLIFLTFLNNKITAQDICDIVDGSKVIADDGQYLGKICNPFNHESIFNEFGTHGNKFNLNSIWNKFGSYGNQFSKLSPFNKFSTSPPMIIKNGKVIGYLTKNKSLSNAVDPHILLSCEFGLSSIPSELKDKIKQLDDEKRKLNELTNSDNHWIQKVIENGKYILLEDKSLWEISPIDVIYTSIWLPITNILIVESKNRSFPYYLINTDDGEKVAAKLIKK